MTAPLAARVFGRPPRQRVGLLGGSFNPAHAGHRHISELALKYLRLEEIWWLVSPQNPLKPTAGMAPVAARLAAAAAACRHPRIRATAIEERLGSRYTADTLAVLCARFPRTRFVWLMGADNLIEIARWENWRAIFRAMPVAVFARPAYSLAALAGLAARHFSRARRRPHAAGRLARLRPPAWVFFHARLHAASATQLRNQRQGAGGRRRRGKPAPTRV
ncbi:MAG: nicotinate-nucleotide adenylyltransferase [Pseudomonadota bacterium]